MVLKIRVYLHLLILQWISHFSESVRSDDNKELILTFEDKNWKLLFMTPNMADIQKPFLATKTISRFPFEATSCLLKGVITFRQQILRANIVRIICKHTFCFILLIWIFSLFWFKNGQKVFGLALILLIYNHYRSNTEVKKYLWS